MDTTLGIRLFEAIPKDMIVVRFGPDTRGCVVAAPAYMAGPASPTVPHDLMEHVCMRMRFESSTLYRWEFAKDAGPNTASLTMW